MKLNLALAIVASLSALSANANPIDVVIYGQGGNQVCSVTNTSTFNRRVYIAREMSSLEAESAARNECVRASSFASDCSKATCATDPNNSERIRAQINVVIGNTSIQLTASNMRLTSICMAENTSTFNRMSYVAKGSIELESRAIAMNACLQQASFASDCRVTKCETISEGPTVGVNVDGPNGNINVGGINIPMPTTPPRTGAGRVIRRLGGLFGNDRN